MNPNDDVQRNRLSKAIETSYRGMEWLRNLTRGLVECYAGSGYGRPGRPKRETIINLMNQTVDAYTMALVANRPRIVASTQIESRTFFAKKYALAMNRLIEEITLESVLKNWVLDAFFGMGIVKVHMADAGMVELSPGYMIDPGKPWASNVGIDNWVHDLTATKWEHVQYAGDTYRVPFSDLQSQPQYFSDVVADLEPTSKHDADGDRIEQIARGEVTDDDELEPMIDLADIWIPREGRIFTFPVDRRGLFQIKAKPVADMPWDGPEHGPYHLMGFNPVPENIIPTSMAAQLHSLFQIINNILRKQAKQAQRQKTVHTYSASGVSDATKLQKANDGEFVLVNDPNQIGEVRIDGVDNVNQAFVIGAMEMFDRMAGNLTAMLGLGAQTPTLGQEQMVASKVSAKEAQMQYTVLDCASKLIRDLGWMLWSDKAKVMPGRLPVEGTDITVDATWHPDDREGSFFDYDIQIDVFSMSYQSPAQRVSAINQLLTQIYAPLAQQLAAQGGQFNLQKLTELYADLLNLPQLKECVQFVAPIMQQPDEESSPPTNTTRNYTRRSVAAGPTPQNQSRISAEQWLSMGSHAGNGAMNGNGAT
jgi:hypothetical protein